MKLGKNAKDLFTVYINAFRILWQASPGYTFFSVLLSVVRALVLPAQIWLLKLIIDQITLAVQSSSSSFDWQAITLLIAAMGILWFLDKLGDDLDYGVSLVIDLQAEKYSKFKILEKASQMDIAFFEHPTFYDQMHNAFRETWRVSQLSYICRNVLGALVSLVGLFILLASQLHPLFVLLLVITGVPQMIVKANYSNRLFSLVTGRTPAERMAGYTEHLLLERDFVKEIRLFGLQNFMLDKIQTFRSTFVQQNQQAWASQMLGVSLMSLLSVAGLGVVWFFAIVQAVAGRISLGGIVVVLQTAEQVRSQMNNLFHDLGTLYEHGLFVNNLLTFLALQPDDVEGALQPSGEAKVPPGLLEIEFRKVSFRYPGSDKWILRDVSFTLGAGEKVALVGENGEGKTTLVKLLTRLYDPIEGEILLNGRVLRDYDLADLHAHMGVIFQDFVHYHFSAKDNIGFGQVDKLEDIPSILKAASKGGASSVIDQLPQGLDTPLGKTLEEGVDLSGGQWQKLALSRAFMRDTPLLILDEPSSSLDPLAEYEIYRQFAELTQGKTVLFISHRFSSVRMASRILVLKQGSLIGNGSHQDLLQSNAHYAEMFHAQASSYSRY